MSLSDGGGLTLGFWSNKNGQELQTSSDFALLTSLCSRNANGGPQDFASSLANNKTALNTWCLNATATNMAYMLSAQLAAMELNVAHGSSAEMRFSAPECGNTGFERQLHYYQ